MTNRAATGSDLPLCSNRNQAWSGADAAARVAKWASKDGSGDKATISWSKYSQAFLWVSSSGGNDFADYKLGFADVIDGKLQAVWLGIAACAAVMQGSRGGVHIPVGDESRVESQIESYYKGFSSLYKDASIKLAPWKRSLDPRLHEFETRFGAFGGIEQRTVAFNAVKVRASGDTEDSDGWTVEGYAAVFNSPSLDLGGFTETIAPGAFTRALSGHPEVIGNWNHDNTRVLGSTANGTLALREDPMQGLRYWIRPAATSYAADLRVLLDRGDIDGASFQFTVSADDWEITTGPDGEEVVKRTILEIGELVDVCVCAQGAYPAASSDIVLSYCRDYATARAADMQYQPAPYTPGSDETIQCPGCGLMNDTDATFCDQCGAAIVGLFIEEQDDNDAGTDEDASMPPPGFLMPASAVKIAATRARARRAKLR